MPPRERDEERERNLRGDVAAPARAGFVRGDGVAQAKDFVRGCVVGIEGGARCRQRDDLFARLNVPRCEQAARSSGIRGTDCHLVAESQRVRLRPAQEFGYRIVQPPLLGVGGGGETRRTVPSSSGTPGTGPASKDRTTIRDRHDRRGDCRRHVRALAAAAGCGHLLSWIVNLESGDTWTTTLFSNTVEAAS